MLVKQSLQNIKTLLQRQNLLNKQTTKLIANKNNVGDVIELSNQTAKQTCKNIKEIIAKSIGGNIEIKKDFQDLGRFYSMKMFFKKPTLHYIYIDKNKSTKLKTYIGGHISCYYDKNNMLKKLFVFDWTTKSVRQFNKDGVLMKHFTPEETYAMFKYKNSSTNIHKVLRSKKTLKNQNEIEKIIKNLSQIFENGKASVTTQEIIAYRALDKQSLKTIMSMAKDGMIFKDPSFTSVATKKSSIYQFLNFKNYNHIMQIKIPSNSKYINLDEIGHIIQPQKAENELLLKGNFLIKSRKGMIIAEYIG